MELSGALLNLFHPWRLDAAANVRERLLGEEREASTVAPPLRRRQRSVLDAVTRVLMLRGEPMRVREIHAELESAFQQAVPFSSVNEALSTHSRGHADRFRRVRYGVYAMRS